MTMRGIAALVARSLRDHLNQARAALHCPGDLIVFAGSMVARAARSALRSEADMGGALGHARLGQEPPLGRCASNEGVQPAYPRMNPATSADGSDVST